MPRVADLPPGWRHFTTAQKIDHLIGLDRCYEILSWGSITKLDPLRRSFQWKVVRVLLSIGIKAVLDGSLDRDLARERNRAAMLEELARHLSVGTRHRTRTGRSRCASGAKKLAIGLGNCAQFSGFPRPRFGAQSARRRRLTADPLFCGRRDAVAKLIGNQLHRIEKLLCVVG
jgi:hypothetical protein